MEAMEVQREPGRLIGRPTACTPEVIATLVDAIEQGASIRIACSAADITHPTFYAWKARGEEGEEPFRTFLTQVTQAEARHALDCCKVLNGLSVGSEDDRVRLESAKYFLSYRYSSDYGTRSATDVNVGGQIEHVHVAVVGVGSADLAAIMGRLSTAEREMAALPVSSERIEAVPSAVSRGGKRSKR